MTTLESRGHVRGSGGKIAKWRVDLRVLCCLISNLFIYLYEEGAWRHVDEETCCEAVGRPTLMAYGIRYWPRELASPREFNGLI